MKRIFIFSIIILGLTGCQSFLGQFYGVHEPMTPLAIDFEQKINRTDFEQFIDTSNSINKNICSYTSIEKEKDDRIICLSDSICECYFLNISDNKVLIQAIYNSDLGAYWLTKKEQVDDMTIDRIRQRFKDKVLTPFDECTK